MDKVGVAVFLPVRKGSDRIPSKNTKKFANFNGGLLELKMSQLIDLKFVDEIVVSSNDVVCIEIAENFRKLSSKVKIDLRPDHLAHSDTNLTDLVRYVPNICSQEHILWTHVTSPFLNMEFYSRAVMKYQEVLKKGYDSLMTARKVQSFLWDVDKNEVVNKTNDLKWPRTQDLKFFYELDSGAFIASRQIYEKLGDRVGLKPYIFENNLLEGFDIDWPEDFELAQKLYSKLL